MSTIAVTTAISQPVSQAQVRGSVEASRSGIWVGIFVIIMSFAALTSALLVRQGSGEWSHIVLPSILYANTAALLLSSFSMEMSRRALARSAGVTSWLAITLLLGLSFVSGQYLAWRQLAAQGLYLATNPNSSFLYVFTGMHALHLLCGITLLVYLFGQVIGGARYPPPPLPPNPRTPWPLTGGLWLFIPFFLST